MQIMSFFALFPVFLITCFAILSVNAYQYPSYQSCSPYTCNGLLVKYPFNDCGYSNVHCAGNHNSLSLNTHTHGYCPRDLYRIVGDITESSYANKTIRVACNENPLDVCHTTYAFVNWVYIEYGYYLSDEYKSGTVLICNKEPTYSSNLKPIKCLECRRSSDLCYFLLSGLSTTYDENCVRQYGVVITSNKGYNITEEKNLRELLLTGFDIKWNVSDDCTSCEGSGGICHSYSEPLVCICPDGAHKYNCSNGKLLNLKKWWMTSTFKAAIGVFFGVFIISTIIFIYKRINRKKREQQEEERDIRGYMDPLDSTPPSVENFLHAGIPTRYSYRQVKRYSNNFEIRLGQGGFGTVYKGELPNGCLVAVKILDKSKQSRIQFMNEVATIGRIHHLHLVRLLGYCFEGSKRALIYEYMINGSLEKYIHGDDPNLLNWKQLYSIAMGTARGIAYLHDECRSKILHCDIKPHNVLLDANYSPKVADFGLAKLTDREESHVSLTGARGTPGYVAPEVWSRSIGPVTDRSDVYSYGMLVMEMVGGRKNFDMKATRSSKFYYPEWAFKQVEMGEFQNLRGENIENDEDEVMAKKLSMLGLWCIQYNPLQRPSMSKVIQMLEGTVDITVPPQPFPFDTPVDSRASTQSSSSM